MGILRAISSSVSGVMADQWKDIFTCDSMPNNVLLQRETKHVSPYSSNKNGSDMITDGSRIIVADGMAAIVVSEGTVTAVATEPGAYEYSNPKAVPIFKKGGLKNSAAQVWERIGYGGDAPGTMDRVYYINTKPIMQNPFRTPETGIPIRIVDEGIGLDLDCHLICAGYYTFKVSRPEVLYKSVTGNVGWVYFTHNLQEQLEMEIISMLRQACDIFSTRSFRLSSITQVMPAICEEIRMCFNAVQEARRGLSLVDISFSVFNIRGAEANMILQAQHTKMLCDPRFADAYLTKAEADSLRIAAANEGHNFYTMPILMGDTGNFVHSDNCELQGNRPLPKMGMSAQALYGRNTLTPEEAAKQKEPMSQAEFWARRKEEIKQEMDAQDRAQEEIRARALEEYDRKHHPEKYVKKDEWTCSCGHKNTGKFCEECGEPKPVSRDWTCSCGKVNTGKFCEDCGAPRLTL